MSQDGSVDEEGASDPPRPQLPSVDELKNVVADAQKSESAKSQAEFERGFRRAAVEAERAFIHAKGLADHYRHKGHWSTWLLVLILALMVFQSGIVVFVGLGTLNYEKYQWLLPALLVQNLTQIIGLAIFVVRSLFKEMRED